MSTIPFAGEGETDFGALVSAFDIPKEMYVRHRAKLLEHFRSLPIQKNSVIIMQSGPSPVRYDSDFEPVFRQESSFAYLFGVKEPDVYATIEVDTGKTTLFFPELPPNYAIFMGEVRTAESFAAEYDVDEVLFTPKLREYLESVDPVVLYTSNGFNADSGRYSKPAIFDGIEDFRVDNGVLYEAIVHCRVYKSEDEIKLMRHINGISSEAHCWVMAHARPGMREFQLESMFQHWGYFRGGCRHQSYTSICGCEDHGAVLHYGHAGAPNDGLLRDGDMALLDMGAEYKCYTSDITCSFPVNGKFTDDQKFIYEAVLASQFGVMRAMKPGVSYIDMHALAYKIILEKLTEGGLLSGDVDEMMDVNLGAVFMPHGLGHFMGLDTHDVGGRPKGHKKQTLAGFSNLRCCLELEPNMVLTVEPGIYFNDYSLDQALANPDQAKFINTEMLERFRGFGGIRLEDDVLVTETGIENFTKCPRTLQDVEDVISGKLNAHSTFTTYLD